MIRLTLLFLLFSFGSLQVNFGQTKNCKCCTSDHANFDFWVGEWVVYDTIGNKLGENVIQKIENECLITEKWTGVQGSSGRSMNYYEPKDSTWNQVWVSNAGNNLNLKGKYMNNSIVLRSELIRHPNQVYYNQITWTPLQNGTVHQIWEIYNETDDLIQTIFFGVYIPKRQLPLVKEEN